MLSVLNAARVEGVAETPGQEEVALRVGEFLRGPCLRRLGDSSTRPEGIHQWSSGSAAGNRPSALSCWDEM